MTRCDICGATDQPLDDSGWSAQCVDNPECRWPLGPIHRKVKPMTMVDLESLELECDDVYDSATVPAAELRWLIACARKVLDDA